MKTKYAFAYRRPDNSVKYVICTDGKWFFTTDEARDAGYDVLYR
jgi:hypothetical protein